MGAYVKSKALAERATWDLMRTEGGALELAVVNPSGTFGPALSPDIWSSLELIKRLLNGSMPACPDRWFGVGGRLAASAIRRAFGGRPASLSACSSSVFDRSCTQKS